jgi:putative oxidoreductase
LQRLFSTFPHGSPGIGLLLLRAGAAAVLIVQGVACLALRHAGTWGTSAAGATEILSGALLIIGLMTPLASVVGAIGTAGAALSWFPWPMPFPSGTGIGSLLRVTVLVGIALLGPGAISVDALLFGRREITIPRMRDTARGD